MTKKVTHSNRIEKAPENFQELSIQVGLNGLSFCVLDTITNKIVAHKDHNFEGEHGPHDLHGHLQDLLEAHGITKKSFSKVVVVHRNDWFALVPRPLFIEDEMANYLKFNAKILANDHIDFDEIDSHDMVNIYVPFMNVNNYIYDIYGEFEFFHHGSVLVRALLNSQNHGKEPICYVHLADQQMDLTVVSHKKLLLHNSFNFTTQEDFLYYLLFVLEQLQLDPGSTSIKLFGAVQEGDAIYDLCHRYAGNVALFDPPASLYPLNIAGKSVGHTMLNAY